MGVPRSAEQIHESVTRNLNAAAEVIDALEASEGDIGLAFRVAVEGDRGVGPVRKFYREVAGHHPSSQPN